MVMYVIYIYENFPLLDCIITKFIYKIPYRISIQIGLDKNENLHKLYIPKTPRKMETNPNIFKFMCVESIFGKYD